MSGESVVSHCNASLVMLVFDYASVQVLHGLVINSSVFPVGVKRIS